MKKLFSRRKKPATIGRISHLHDSNEDILRIIKLYNQGTIKTINEDDPVKYPWLLKYRASNLYVFITAALSIVSSVSVLHTLVHIELTEYPYSCI